MPLMDAVRLLNREIAAQSSVLMDLDNIGIYHTGWLPSGCAPVPASSPVKFLQTGHFVLGLFGKNNRATAFMLVNRRYDIAATARISLAPPVRGVEEFDRIKRQWRLYQKSNANEGMEIELSPGDGRLFRFLL
jgi:hypothetical protein